MGIQRRQGIFWLLTIPDYCFVTYLPPGCTYITGQLETAPTTGYVHWQLLVATSKKASLAQIKEIFGAECHGELSRSSAAQQYCQKEESRIEGTQFELGR